MKNIKKLLALVLALAICAAFALPALAGGDPKPPENNKVPTPSEYTGKHQIVLEKAVKGHTYALYQVFAGKVYNPDEGNDQFNNPKLGMTDIVYGSGWSSTDSEGKSIVGTTVPASVLNGLTDEEAVDKYIRQNADDISIAYADPSKIDEESGVIQWLGLADGYYVIKDLTDVDEHEKDAASAFIVRVAGDVTVTPKSTIPEGDKSARGEKDEPVKVCDASIGDSITYDLTATIDSTWLDKYRIAPDGSSSNGVYKLVFHDTMSKGLTFDASAKVMMSITYNGQAEGEATSVEIPATTPDSKGGVYTTSTEADGGTKLEVTIPNLFNYLPTTPASGNVVVKVTYKATVNEEAKIYQTDADGNTNSFTLEYSNKPTDATQTGTTPPSKVDVYTFQLDVTKVDGTNENAPLENVGFTLYKGTDTDKANPLKFVKKGNSYVLDTKNTEGAQEEIFSDANGKLNFAGLSHGIYILSETSPLPGYNEIKDMTIEIIAEYNTTDKTKPVVSVSHTKDGGEAESGIAETVINNKGSVLPSTGGIGTTIFYAVGAVLVIGAGVLLFTKKRMHG